MVEWLLEGHPNTVNIASMANSMITMVNGMTSMAMASLNFVQHSMMTLTDFAVDSLTFDAFDDAAMCSMVNQRLTDGSSVVVMYLHNHRMTMWQFDDMYSVDVAVNCK